MHFAAGRNAVALTNRNGQGAKHQPGGLFRQRIGKIGGLRRDPCLQGVGQRVQPGMGCDGGRYANHQRRVDDRHVGTERLMEQRVLDPFFRVADDAGAGHYRTGTVAGGQRGAQSVKQRRARQEAVADDPDVLMAKALQRGQAARAAVEARLQRKGMHGAPG